MAHLAVALACRGFKVTYVAQRAMTVDRARQGWPTPSLPGVAMHLADSNEAVQKMVELAPTDSIHICQGVRANELVGLAQRALAVRGLRQWVVMETVNDTGWHGFLKRTEYTRIFQARAKSLQGVLAIGHRTADWVIARGMPADRVYPFAYFLPNNKTPEEASSRQHGPFRFVFAGRLIQLKRVDWLISALAGLEDQAFELWVVGNGVEKPALRKLAADKLGQRVRWLGQLALPDVPAVMAQTDCLVLPSVHDGWGAVASEALMVGIPVICSDACGVAGVVRSSGQGGVFGYQNGDELGKLLQFQLNKGPVSEAARQNLGAWAQCLGADAGAQYLMNIFEYSEGQRNIRPLAPWDLNEPFSRVEFS